MLGKALKFVGGVTKDILVAYLFDEERVEDSEDKRQLDNLSDGNGAFFIDGDHYTQQEAEDMQSRGELYDTYY